MHFCLCPASPLRGTFFPPEGVFWVLLKQQIIITVALVVVCLCVQQNHKVLYCYQVYLSLLPFENYHHHFIDHETKAPRTATANDKIGTETKTLF